MPRSRASGWSLLTTLWGFPCCVRFPCVHAVATTPAQRLGVLFALLHPAVSLPRKGCRVGLRIVLFEDCSAFTRVTACTLALSPIGDTLIEGFSHFVTSMTAPIASGWSGCRVGLTPTGKRRLVTAHTQCRLRHPVHLTILSALASNVGVAVLIVTPDKTTASPTKSRYSPSSTAKNIASARLY